MRPSTLLVAVACCGVTAGTSAAQVQVRADTSARPASVQGVAYDSLRGAPLAGAQVQLAAASNPTGGQHHAARTDSAGRFIIRNVTPGDYLAVFFHPLLDSLGLEAAPRPVRVTDTLTRLDLAVPSATTLRSAIFPTQTGAESSALLIGHVRGTANGAPLGGAVVRASWSEWTLLAADTSVLRPTTRHGTGHATPEGWFALCGLPAEVPLLVQAAHATDSSGFVRVRLPAGGMQHIAFLVGEATPAMAAGPDSAPPHSVWRGAARLTGQVRDAAGQPVSGAQVTVWGTEIERRSTTGGHFALDSLPGGTQTLEVRAIGYAPVTQMVQLSAAQPAEVAVTLGERATTLPATTVRAREGTSLRLRDFYQRLEDARKGINRGYFITAEELERRRPPLITNMFDGIPGLAVDRKPGDRLGAVVRGPLREPDRVLGARRCQMSVFLDGIQIVGGPGGDGRVDANVIPSEVAAIEVYPHPVSAPPQYQPLNGRCGVILIWTK